MWVVITLCMCRYSDTNIYSPILFECFLYCACLITVIQLYVTLLHESGIDIVHVSWLWYSYMQPSVMWVVIILYMCRHCDTFICSPVLFEWLLYCGYVVTEKIMCPNTMWVVIILLMCRHCNTVTCRPLLYECFLYCSWVVSMIQFYVAQCYVCCYYTVHVSWKWYSYI
jgi:hypothetical protein